VGSFNGLNDSWSVDAEGEYFLHHEEIYHNTPATQTDQAYNHPEDIEHFSHHAEIELNEDNLLRVAQGLKPLDENGNEMDMPVKKPKEEYGHALGEESEQHVFQGVYKGEEETERQIERFANARNEADRRGAWKGAEGRPKDLADRLRKAVPYKYRVKNSW
jgi:nucleobindin